ncbi:cytochrome c-type biogenesis protein [Methyloraptor flagellatus]|uniref:Cytochrome c-type biogenesis protein n=1 Tax=Methyloraptor flagellatus TaxID=3162530 RepID=A0AAU7X728_9HYPH
MAIRSNPLRRTAGLVLAVALGFASVAPALAVRPDEILPDAAMEKRAREISAELRCMVCQNQSIDDSDAPLARDLRILVRDRLKSGDTDEQVKDFLVDRYGQFVLLKPRFEWETAILWIGPFAVLALGAVGVFAAARRRRAAPAGEAVALSAEEKAKLDRILADEA